MWLNPFLPCLGPVVAGKMNSTNLITVELSTMKSLILSIGVACLALVSTQAADVTVKLSNVHLCCANCVKGVDKAVGTVTGATAACDKDAGSVTLTAADKATVQTAADALISAGYFGKNSATSIKSADNSGAKGKKVQTLQVTGG